MEQYLVIVYPYRGEIYYCGDSELEAYRIYKQRKKRECVKLVKAIVHKELIQGYDVIKDYKITQVIRYGNFV